MHKGHDQVNFVEVYQRRRDLKSFAIYGRGGHLSLMTITICTYFD